MYDQIIKPTRSKDFKAIISSIKHICQEIVDAMMMDSDDDYYEQDTEYSSNYLDEIRPNKGELKIMLHHIATQECSECGKRFTVLYCDDGCYEYFDEPCKCEASFHAVDGELSISEWLEKIKGGIT